MVRFDVLLDRLGEKLPNKGPNRYGVSRIKSTMLFGPKYGHFQILGAEIPTGVVRALVTLQHGLEQDACIL